MMETVFDRGVYRWLVLFAAFLGQLLAAGTVLTVGSYLVEWQDTFQSSDGQIGGVSTVLVFGFHLSGYFAGALCKRVGCRRIMAAGGAISTLCFFLASFSTQLWHLYVTLSVAGIGFAACYMPCIEVVKYHFKKRLGLANGMVYAGISAGIVVMAPLTERLCLSYGWKGSMRIHSALIANLLVCAALFRPTRQERLCLEKFKNSRHSGLHHEPDDHVEMEVKGSLQERLMEGYPPEELKAGGVGKCSNDRQPHTEEIELTRCSNEQLKLKSRHVEYAQVEKGQPTEVLHDEVLSNNSLQQANRTWCCLASTCLFQLLRCLDQFFALSRLLKIHLYMSFVICVFVFSCGYISTVVFISPRLVNDLGFSKQAAARVMTIVGISGLVARVAQGVILDHNILGPTNSYLLCTFVSGINPLLNPIVKSQSGHLILAVLFGAASGSASSLIAVMCRRYVPSDIAPNAFGLLVTCASFGIMIGTVLMGKLRDLTGSYNAPFLVAGAMMWSTTIIMGIVTKLSCWRESKTVKSTEV